MKNRNPKEIITNLRKNTSKEEIADFLATEKKQLIEKIENNIRQAESKAKSYLKSLQVIMAAYAIALPVAILISNSVKNFQHFKEHIHTMMIFLLLVALISFISKIKNIIIDIKYDVKELKNVVKMEKELHNHKKS